MSAQPFADVHALRLCRDAESHVQRLERTGSLSVLSDLVAVLRELWQRIDDLGLPRERWSELVERADRLRPELLGDGRWLWRAVAAELGRVAGDSSKLRTLAAHGSRRRLRRNSDLRTQMLLVTEALSVSLTYGLWVGEGFDELARRLQLRAAAHIGPSPKLGPAVELWLSSALERLDQLVDGDRRVLVAPAFWSHMAGADLLRWLCTDGPGTAPLVTVAPSFVAKYVDRDLAKSWPSRPRVRDAGPALDGDDVERCRIVRALVADGLTPAEALAAARLL